MFTTKKSVGVVSKWRGDVLTFDEGAKTIIFALISCSGIFAYLGIMLGKNEGGVTGQKHFPLKWFFILLSCLLVIGTLGVSIYLAESQCIIPGVCNVNELQVINMTFDIMICLLTALLFILGYFVVMLVNWVAYFLKARKTKRDGREDDYEKG